MTYNYLFYRLAEHLFPQRTYTTDTDAEDSRYNTTLGMLNTF
jgi:hypothetical protein